MDEVTDGRPGSQPGDAQPGGGLPGGGLPDDSQPDGREDDADGEQSLDRVELPLSGLIAELLLSGAGLLHWRLTPGPRRGLPWTVSGAAADAGARGRPQASPSALERFGVLGWSYGALVAPEVGTGSQPFTVAWGSLSGLRVPLRVVVVRDRRLRRARRYRLEPVTLGEVFWVVEATGRFDRVVVCEGHLVESRDLVLRPLRTR